MDYRSVMYSYLYGPRDNYRPENSHVIPTLLRRFLEAKVSNAPEVIIWSTGAPRREFLYVDDMARPCIFVMELAKEQYNQVAKRMQSYFNGGYGSNVTIHELAHAVAKALVYH